MNSDLALAAEQARLDALARTAILHTGPEKEFDLLSTLAAELCHTPYAFITFIDATDVWAKSWYGVDHIDREPRCDTYCDVVVRSAQPLFIADAQQDDGGPARAMAREGLRMYAGVPLLTSERIAIGTLCILDEQPREPNPHQIELLQSLAAQVMALVELRQYKRELEASLVVLERLANNDELTGLMNRRRLLQRLREECARGRRFHEPLSVILLDLDHFKMVNDRWGHAAGDAVLANTGRLILDTLRETDCAGRYGGEELCLVLPNTAADGVLNVAEILRARLESLALAMPAEPGYVTGSFGVAIAISEDEFHPDALLAHADAAMYRAKHQGRNRVILAGPAGE